MAAGFGGGFHAVGFHGGGFGRGGFRDRGFRGDRFRFGGFYPGYYGGYYAGYYGYGSRYLTAYEPRTVTDHGGLPGEHRSPASVPGVPAYCRGRWGREPRTHP